MNKAILFELSSVITLSLASILFLLFKILTTFSLAFFFFCYPSKQFQEEREDRNNNIQSTSRFKSWVSCGLSNMMTYRTTRYNKFPSDTYKIEMLKMFRYF